MTHETFDERFPLVDWKVTEDQIDHNEHLNMMNYALQAGEASKELARRLNIIGPGQRVFAPDTFVRYYREQMLGAELDVRGGVVDRVGEMLRVYHEIHNHAKAERSAVIIQDIALVDAASGNFVPMPDCQWTDFQTSIPEHGMPRTLKLDAPGFDVDVDELDARGLRAKAGAFGAPGPRIVDADECDELGFMVIKPGQNIGWGRRRTPEEMAKDPKFRAHLERAKKHRTGWVTLENRSSIAAIPRLGDELVTFNAIVGLERKTRQRKMWTYNATTGQMIGVLQQVDLAFSLDARKGIDITDAMLETWDEVVAPEFA